MKFTSEKKHSIMMYLLEQIDQQTQDVSKAVAQKCGLSRNTINKYLNELVEQNIIGKIKRNQYELISVTANYSFRRNQIELSSDTYVFERIFQTHIRNCSKEAKKIWYYAFSEMVNNVIDHSMAESLELMVIQNYLKTTVVLADDGIGIFEKIKEHFSLASLDEARCELFKGKLTTDEKNHSGEGIFFSSRMMDFFMIVSSGQFFSINKYQDNISMDLEIPQSGTMVIMSLSNNTHREIAKVFEQYSNVDDGFTKTQIPMKNIFDHAPVSRSQAKRITNRLDKFKEVTFDFSEIEWMGQAFAHQLFVVFQNEHPDIVLTPVHMNKDVDAIYQHVLLTK